MPRLTLEEATAAAKRLLGPTAEIVRVSDSFCQLYKIDQKAYRVRAEPYRETIFLIPFTFWKIAVQDLTLEGALLKAERTVQALQAFDASRERRARELEAQAEAIRNGPPFAKEERPLPGPPPTRLSVDTLDSF